MTRDCVFRCGTLLGAYDQELRKYREVETGEYHTKDRCEAAKLKIQEKNNHGNEEFIAKEISRPTITAPIAEFKDHTARPHLKIKTLTDVTTEGFDLKYNTFAESHNVHFSQYHPIGSMYTMVVWYEELK